MVQALVSRVQLWICPSQSTIYLIILVYQAQIAALAITQYVKHLLQEMTVMEDKTYNLNGKDMKFRFAEFANDLKMLAFLVGELSVSTRYFSTFANVNTGNCDDVAGTFGEGPGLQ